jgi:hydroxylysine kinase
MQTDSTNTVIQQMMTTQAPMFSNAEAAAIAASHYGIDAQAHPLVSERDQNFRLDATDSRRYMLKVSNHAEQSMIVDFQNCALQHAGQQDPSLPLPRVIPDLQGASYCSVEKDGNTHFVRILSWLDGRILGDGNTDADLSNRLGRLLARLGLAFKDFDHPGSNPPSLWDMKRASGLRDLLAYIEETDLRQLLEQTLDRFDSHVKPRLAMLRTQVIHNDLNLGNVLMDKAQKNHISGIIDFGDIVKSPLVFDLAIASAYQLSDDDPLQGALPMIAGYHAVRKLQDLEIELLTDLIRTRLITSLLIGSYRVSLFPENREYLTISHKPAISYLTRLQDLGNGEAIQRIRDSFFKT